VNGFTAQSLFAAAPPPKSIELRAYQRDAVERVFALVKNGTRRVLLVAPTGAGKTICLAAIAVDVISRGQHLLVLAHRFELIDQTVGKLVASGVPLDSIGVVMPAASAAHLKSGARRNPGAPIQVASIDTLRGWVGKRGMPLADWIIIDEAHRAAAQSYRSIVAAYPNAVVIGLTATPWRLDGQGLADMFDEPVVVATMPQLIAQGFLVPFRCYSHPSRPDFSQVRVRAGEFVEEDVKRAMGGSLLLGSIPEHYLSRADGRAAFGFAVDVEEAHRLADACTAAGIPSVAVSGASTIEERARALADLRAGRIRIVWNVALFIEGTDVEEVKCIILARPTLSRTFAFQKMGRGSRPAAHTGFHDCVVLDHAGVLQIHGHPLEPQDYSLHGTRQKTKLGTSMTKTCPDCGLEIALGTTLCACGHVWERERSGPVEVPGKLVEHAPRPAVILSASAEDDLCRRAIKQAVAQEAKNVASYARSILEKQLRRAPDKKIFEKALIAILNAPKEVVPSDWRATMNSRLASAAPAPAPTPAPTVNEEIVEVRF
jgi:DNA repair protein RadD